jgi:3-oxoacyl-[acyl-carrier-protein] synthase III
MKIYINGSSSISAHKVFEPSMVLTEPVIHSGDRLTCVEPEYDKIMEPSQIRRLSRILKMGMATSMKAIKQAANPQIDAIIAGTGFGCLDDTARFLLKMIDPDDRSMNPTAFIQSTYNTISSLVAINLKNNGYNNTFVHSGFSFESALDDAILLLKTGEARNVLVGGVDELTTEVYDLLKRLQKARIKTKKKELSLQPAKTYLFGEGSSFFVLSDKPNSEGSVEITNFSLLYKPEKDQIISSFENFTRDDKTELFMLGKNNETINDESYNWISSLIDTEKCFNYKTLCGDYPTALSFGLWLAASILSGSGNPMIPIGKIDNVLLYNCFERHYHAFISLKRS